MALSRVSPPSEPQILALNRLLESVVLEHGLCPASDLPRRQEIAKDVSRTVCSTHPGKANSSPSHLRAGLSLSFEAAEANEDSPVTFHKNL